MATTTDNINIKINVDTSKADTSTDNLKKRIKELRDAMAQLKAAGKDTSEEYQRMAQEAGRLQDAIGDVSQEIKNLADDNQTLAATIQGVGAGVAVFGGLQAATALLGVEDKNLLQIIQKVQATQALLNSVNTIAQALNKSSALMTALRAKSEKSLNQELVKTTEAETAGTVATATFTAAEGAATTGAITLRGAVKAVGTAIKSVPVIGWVLAAIAVITTLISLISDANEEEEKGNRLRERERQLLDDIHGKHAQVIDDIMQQNAKLNAQIRLLNIINKDSIEYKDTMKELASFTGLSADYIESLTEEQKIALNNTYTNLEREKEHLLELEEIGNEYQKRWDEARQKQYSDDEDERKKAIADLNWMANESSDYYKKNKENDEKIAAAKDRITNAEKEVNKERQKELDWQKKQTAQTKALAEVEKERKKFIEDSRKEIEELNNAIYGQDEEEKITEHYDRLLDLAIKYYGTESEEYAKVSEMRLQALEELRKKQSEADEELAKQRLADERAYEDEHLQAVENGIKAEIEVSEAGSREWYEKKIELDRHQEDREKLELERKLEDNLISQELYLSEYELLVAEHANARAEIEMEANRKVADDYKEKMQQRLSYAETFVNAFSSVVNSAMDAELEAVAGNEEQEKQVRKKYAKAQFLSEIAGIGVNTASAIMGAWNSVAEIVFPGNVIAGGILTAMLASTGMMQTAQAMSSMQKALSYGKGGYINGKSHNEGGVDINAEGGEAVINKRAVGAYAPLLSAINQSTGGAPINVVGGAQGRGQITTTVDKNALREIVSEVVGGVTSIPVVVTERDITDSQSERKTIVSRGRI